MPPGVSSFYRNQALHGAFALYWGETGTPTGSMKRVWWGFPQILLLSGVLLGSAQSESRERLTVKRGGGKEEKLKAGGEPCSMKLIPVLLVNVKQTMPPAPGSECTVGPWWSLLWMRFESPGQTSSPIFTNVIFITKIMLHTMVGFSAKS